MRRVLSRTAALLGAVFAALLIVSPLMIATAQTPTTAEDVLMQDEAWFFRHRQPLAPVPEVNDPAGASGIPRAEVRNRTTTPFQPETLHVAVVSGEQEALTFLNFPLFELTDDGMPPTVTGGNITLVDGGSSLGSKRADAAEMVACLATELFVAAQGGDWADVPAYDCATRATVQLVEGSTPLTWTIDLAPFASAWSDPSMNYGIAIVPDPDSATPPPDQSWQVAFQAKDWAPPEPSPRDEVSPPPAKAPITADLRFVPQAPLPGFDDSGTSGSVDTDFSGGSFDSGSGDFGTGFTDTGNFEAPVPEVGEVPAEEPVVNEEVAAPAPTDQEERGVRTNPAVYLLPFLGLGLAGMLGYSLSHDPELPSERDGAVSKLMARRRAGLGG